jgi:hypothetical protein
MKPLPLLVFLFAITAQAQAVSTPANVMVELSWTSKVDRTDPFNQETLDVVFTEPGGKSRRIPAFWAGGKTWKARYASPVVGFHRYKTVSSDGDDLNGIEGTVEVTAYKGDNPLYLHGPLRVAKDRRYLEHADGTPFFWLGDTWWMGLSKRLGWPEEFGKLTEDRKRKGFNVVQIVAGLYPDMPAFDPRGANEAGFPWEREYARINPAYFDGADKRILYLVDQGIMPCVVGAWGYHLPWLGQEKMRQHQRYVYARWGALPMVWCVAGELNLPYYLSPEFPNHGEKQTAEWERVIGYCRSINGFDRLITSHPTGVGHLSMRGALSDPSLIDFDMLQTPHGQMEVMGRTVEAVKYSYTQRPVMPVVNAEPSYEMLFDRTPAEVVRRVFWVCWAGGVKGYTYGANGIWQLNRRDRPYGNSPWGGGYGKIAWDEAMNLPGSAQVAIGKKFLSAYAWERFEPHPEWVAWADRPVEVRLGDWIWFEEGSATDAPVAARFFRRAFELPAGAKVKDATLAIAADDRCMVWVNGQEIGSHGDWRSVRRFEGIGARLKAGRNVLAVRGENVKSDVTKNPAGLIAGLRVELSDGRVVEIRSDEQWRAAEEGPAGWEEASFDDAGWGAAKVAAAQGAGPWGKIGTGGGDAYDRPYAFGTDKVRLAYVPEGRAVVWRGLKRDEKYRAFVLDPVTGEKRGVEVKVGGDGTWRVEARGAGDWVVGVEE